MHFTQYSPFTYEGEGRHDYFSKVLALKYSGASSVAEDSGELPRAKQLIAVR